ncbi:uncharacterized protein DUF550 [Micromonospora pisi]|uniref:Uncharacterized protein DUF550 n=1 Tax=Micromonospora pisi TaxID=589240 RepID=A0A495JW60_9ACTN|nr:dATP/dGTP pyrophosphohydrolase domain-containing protein [Micromonospora pisi]RKR92818.1 uncharacterized protein DUF550 [Micromonospora pisi]
MPDQPTDLPPVAEHRVVAALRVLDWPDDRGEQYAEDAALMPAEAYYRLAEDAIRAADLAMSPDPDEVEPTDVGGANARARELSRGLVRVNRENVRLQAELNRVTADRDNLREQLGLDLPPEEWEAHADKLGAAYEGAAPAIGTFVGWLAYRRENERQNAKLARVSRERAVEAYRALAEGTGAVIDAAHLTRQREFSERTFGPGSRTHGVLDHIRKELREIEADPEDLGEWVDVVILALDGAWRAGHGEQAIIDAIIAKQIRNEGRTWPDWRTAEPGRAIEHDRSADPEPAHDASHQAAWAVLGADGATGSPAPADVAVRGVRVTRPTERQAGDPDRPIRLTVADVAYADLNTAEAQQIARALDGTGAL